jgi:hypothetical protein
VVSGTPKREQVELILGDRDTLPLDRTRRDRCERRREARRAAVDIDLDRKRPGW